MVNQFNINNNKNGNVLVTFDIQYYQLINIVCLQIYTLHMMK